MRETEAVVEISVDALVLFNDDKVPEVRAVVTTPVEFRICAVVVKNDVPPGPPDAIDQVSEPVRVRPARSVRNLVISRSSVRDVDPGGIAAEDCVGLFWNVVTVKDDVGGDVSGCGCCTCDDIGQA